MVKSISKAVKAIFTKQKFGYQVDQTYTCEIHLE